MKVKFIKNKYVRPVKVISIGNNLLLRIAGKIYLLQNPDNPAPHLTTLVIDINDPMPLTADQIFEIVDKQNAMQDDRQTI